MKIAEMKELTVAELKERLAAEEQNYAHMRINHAVSPLDKPSQLRDTRRMIAQMKTVLREREINNN
ncbi:50S ribosomal protein L29 [Porphyromonas macacae]|uniref:Large ribosomal subunit protein uL29 n=1 Tax=Porphyromonas macacae TaxID=28115 RepID=A0A0A2G8F3_9PORP|nr:50S ribosomal protein L29 [Porphyromonas macacae]KGN72420.1 50S ribosomal protein L29 [Porphyromonas macacae]KGN98712.1 50S ribosomal protein L29 [Porphyromonas macacae]SUB77077.1 50S ribosomal protein L29 [Porphyromonas macacae]SUB88543.1 50S ribosomal protein L29 [Porphyromonas macacae]